MPREIGDAVWFRGVIMQGLRPSLRDVVGQSAVCDFGAGSKTSETRSTKFDQFEPLQETQPHVRFARQKVRRQQRAARLPQKRFGESAGRTLRHIKHAIGAVRRVEASRVAAVEEYRVMFDRVKSMDDPTGGQGDEKRVASRNVARRPRRRHAPCWPMRRAASTTLSISPALSRSMGLRPPSRLSGLTRKFSTDQAFLVGSAS